MARAIELAKHGIYTTDPNPRVGCVIVQGEDIVGEGWHERAGESHAEIHALKAAGDRAKGAAVYLTLEPCCHVGKTPPCTDALIAAKVAEIVVAMTDPNPQVAGQGLKQLQDAAIMTRTGLMEAEAAGLNPGFIKRMRTRRPFVRIKQAISLDGRTALADGTSKWISGETARADVQRLRARSSAILTGIGTVLADDPSLNVRRFDIGRQPLRVVVDSHLSLSPTAKMLQLEGRTLVATGSDDADLADSLIKAGAEVIRLPSSADGVDLAALLDHLAQQEVNELLVEAGAVLCGSLIQAGLVDELVIYLAPHLMGDSARGMLHLPPLLQMEDRIGLTITDVRAIGNDWRIIGKVTSNE